MELISKIKSVLRRYQMLRHSKSHVELGDIKFFPEIGELAAIIYFDSAWAGGCESDLARLELWRGMVGEGFFETYQHINILTLYPKTIYSTSYFSNFFGVLNTLYHLYFEGLLLTFFITFGFGAWDRNDVIRTDYY